MRRLDSIASSRRKLVRCNQKRVRWTTFVDKIVDMRPVHAYHTNAIHDAADGPTNRDDTTHMLDLGISRLS